MSYTIYYDERCPFCHACMEWMRARPSIVPLRFLDAHSSEAKQFAQRCPWLGEELVVENERGEFWVGPAAFVVALWSLRSLRDLLDALSVPVLLPITLFMFAWVSERRSGLGRLLGLPECNGHCGVPERTAYR